jgi:hypothetical protein
MLTAYFYIAIDAFQSANGTSFPASLMALPLASVFARIVPGGKRGEDEVPTRVGLLQRVKQRQLQLLVARLELSKLFGSQTSQDVETALQSIRSTSTVEEVTPQPTPSTPLMGGLSAKTLVMVITGACALLDQVLTFPLQLVRMRLHSHAVESGSVPVLYKDALTGLGRWEAFSGFVWWLPLDVIASFRVATIAWPLYAMAFRGYRRELGGIWSEHASPIRATAKTILRRGLWTALAFGMEFVAYLPSFPLHMHQHLSILGLKSPLTMATIILPRPSTYVQYAHAILPLFMQQFVMDHLSHYLFMQITAHAEAASPAYALSKRKRRNAMRRTGGRWSKKEHGGEHALTTGMTRAMGWVTSITLVRGITGLVIHPWINKGLLRTSNGYSLRSCTVVLFGCAVEMAVGVVLIEATQSVLYLLKAVRKRQELQ